MMMDFGEVVFVVVLGFSLTISSSNNMRIDGV